MLNKLTPRRAATVILAVAAATIATALILESVGYLPCELCLKQRWAYYAALPLAFLLMFAPRPLNLVARSGFWLLALIWLASAVFGAYHSGVEWHWWAGPDTCTGTGALSGGLPDLNAPIVMCDEPAIRILGLSLAGWNALISVVLAAISLRIAAAQGSSSVSQ